MAIKTTPADIWKEYQDGISYDSNIDLYETVRENEDYYNDKQWGCMNLPDLDQPVFNFIKPVVNYYVALMISDDIVVNVDVMSDTDDDFKALVPKVLTSAIDDVMESTNMRYHNRRALRNAALDGDAAMYFYFDPNEDTGEAVKGTIRLDLIDNTNVYFGDTSNPDVQAQPYILLAYRRLLADVLEEAEENGVDADGITPDNDETVYMNTENEISNNYVTCILKLWKDRKTGTVWSTKTTKDHVLKPPVDLQYTRYPLAWMCWEDVKNSYHGVSPVTGKIANQQFINKMYAMAMQYCKMYAFPKVVYDAGLLQDGWNNQIGKAIAVNGNPREAVLIDSAGPGQFNTQSIELAEKTLTETKDLMGASDAALGNVRPDNTSAIIAVQKAANAPLDIQRLVFYNFTEDNVRNLIDIMSVNYGKRSYEVPGEAGEPQTGMFDFSILKDLKMKLKIDIGQGSYWSELMQIQTLDAMMSKQIIPDAITYLECLPDGYVKNKQKIIAKWKELTQQPNISQLDPQQAVPLEQNTESPGQDVAAQIETQPLASDVSDEDLSAICAELEQVPEEKRETVIQQLNVSEETKNAIRQLMKNGGNNHDMSDMQM